MDDQEVIQELIDGRSLYTYMVPDDSIPTNRPLHAQGFCLSNIVVTKDVFWGMSRPGHLEYDHNHVISQSSLFCYTNGFNGIFFHYNPREEGMALMPLSRYKRHEFIVKDNWELIWDSSRKESCPINDFRNLVKSGTRFKIALLDHEDIWNIHPVDLPMCHLNAEMLVMRTELFSSPEIIRRPAMMQRVVKEYESFFKSRPSSKEEEAIRIRCNSFNAFFSVSSDGTYYNYYDIPMGSMHEYGRLKIFCRKQHNQG
jgi:hypothetical protein